ncbi:kinase-like domain-containing protein [Pseudomassariella vexata]|uniref:Kinase-like domain-containing protein n=1 Tax=Pseudomassariella vexata TaxID=1141098 RepID=A0A1Y2DN93_9PEZI|nr:kinase-like domain-containing protein [Pseudomassariella vexata]ORY60624.1 kinase-like domain-containing protein [Pseudomassariella vexata]
MVSAAAAPSAAAPALSSHCASDAHQSTSLLSTAAATPRTTNTSKSSSSAEQADDTLLSQTPPPSPLNSTPQSQLQSQSQLPYTHSPAPAPISIPNPNLQQQQRRASSQSSLSSSPRRYPTELQDSIPEECDETESDTPNEPTTPVSGRQSRDFHAIDHHDTANNSQLIAFSEIPGHPDISITPISKTESRPPLLVHTAATPPTPGTPQEPLTKSFTTHTESSRQLDITDTSFPLERRKSSALSIRGKMTSLFKRTSSNVTENSTLEFRQPNYNGGFDSNETTSIKVTPNSSRHFSFHRSSVTTRSNTPPSPGSSLEMARISKETTTRPTIPAPGDFFDRQKNRASTGFSLHLRGRSKVNFANSAKKVRTRSLERGRRANAEEKKSGNPLTENLTKHPLIFTPDAGTGMKARRLSLSLPDDFTVDIAELTKEFEYQSKLLGRHKHFGKGATSNVALMHRKGIPTELYAVKTFRSKGSSETTAEYEKKIKSEYSIAKSLHHPNIVETFRLATEKGRWNHVMEFCSEGDLYSLVSKKYLQDESRQLDRCCLFKQLVQGVNYLHSNGIAHRDIKLENLLITKDSKLKITDFGVSEVFSGIHPGLREAGGQCGQGMSDEIRLCKPGICGSMPYIAPEVISKHGEYDPRPLDVWSCAIVMIYLTFGANLWDKAEVTTKGPETYNKLVRGWQKVNELRVQDPETYKDGYPNIDAFNFFVNPVPLRRLLLNMLNPDPAKRVTIKDVVNNRWMKNVECCQLESYDDPVKFIDVSKKNCLKSTAGKIYCHNHLPLQSSGHGLPPMPGKHGY